MLAIQPASPATTNMPSDKREAPQYLHHAELAIDLVLVARRAVGILAIDDLGAHGVGGDVLNDDSEYGHEGAEAIEVLGAGEGEPAARRAGEQQHAGGDECGADEHIGAPLRAEDRHAVDQLAEHHLHGPRQRHPNGERGKLAPG